MLGLLSFDHIKWSVTLILCENVTEICPENVTEICPQYTNAINCHNSLHQ